MLNELFLQHFLFPYLKKKKHREDCVCCDTEDCSTYIDAQHISKEISNFSVIAPRKHDL